MSYRLPGPHIYEILTRSSQSLANSNLLPCLVGPLYQVAKDIAISLTLPITTPAVVSYPNMKVGAIIEEDSIVVKVVDAVVAIVNLSTAITNLTFTAGTKTVSSSSVDFTNVKVGDAFNLSGVAGSYIIESISSDFKTLTFTTVVNYVPTIETYSIVRSVGDITAIITTSSYAATVFTVTALTYEGYKIISGSVKISYVALRKDLTGFLEVTDATTLALDMDIDPLNPLGFNAGLIAPAASGGKNLLLYILSDYTYEEYIAAYEQLGVRQDIYFIVPVLNTGDAPQVFNSGIMSAASSNAIAMSDALISYFRAALVITPLVQESILTTAVFTA